MTPTPGKPSVFFPRTLVFLGIYLLCLPFFDSVRTSLPSDSIISIFFIVLFTLSVWSILKADGTPLSEFGITAKGWPRQVLHGMAWSAPVMLAALALKALHVSLHPDELELFEPERVLRRIAEGTWVHWALIAGMYAVFSFAQEFVRCVTQRSIALHYEEIGRPDRWKSIFITATIFCATHVHLGGWFPVLAFLPGLFWGTMYQRERSYLCVAVSHAAIGLWVLFILGVPR